jgi:hypothetical protein
MTSPLVISATRLKVLDVGHPNACERKYAGQYLFGLREEQGTAAQFGEEFHKAAEVYQLTGTVPAPESVIGKLLRSGAHFLRKPGSGALIEYEHRGHLPDGDSVRGKPGTPFVAFLDASDPAPSFGVLSIDHPEARDELQVDDQKTTSAPDRALTDATLPVDLQAMFYAWIMITPHWYAERIPYGHLGPQQWRKWDPTGIRTVQLRWNYFLTRGSPRAWQARAFANLDACKTFMHDRIMPLVERAKALHAAHAAGTLLTLNDAEHDLHACGGAGIWCGAKNECNFNVGGIVALRRNKESKEPMGLADLRAKYGQKKPAAPPAPEPEVIETIAEEETDEEEVEETPAPPPPPAPKTRAKRTPPPAAPPAPAGDTINPPEAVEALAEIRAEVANDNAAAAQAPIEFPLLTVQQASTLSTDVLVGALVLRGYTVTITQSKYEAA